MNQFPNDFSHTLTGFGGDPSLNQAQHRESIKKCPVILVHGNATNSVDPKFGMQPMKGFLIQAGYQECEIWAMDYLGENNTTVDLVGVHRKHIDVFRDFVDKVREYLGVERVDFISHSLGCGMVNAYLRGLQSNGEWDNEASQRFRVPGTFVSLAGAIYGLGPASVDEFITGGKFEVTSHQFGVDTDDTPSGQSDKSKQIAPVEEWKVVTELDDNGVYYVAIIARNDFVDQQNQNTSRRVGADLNKVFDLGPGATGHEQVVKNQGVFDSFHSYLNKYPPVPPISFSVDKDSGNYGTNLQVTLTVSPADVTIAYTAKRLTKAVQAGYLTETVAETENGSLSNKQSLTLANDGAWDVSFKASSGPTLERTYGVNVLLPEVKILSDNSTPFQGSLEVKTSTSKGTAFYSTDKTHWLAQSNPTIHDTTTLYFIAIDADGLASPIVSRAFEKKPVEFVKATLTEHFIAHRIDVNEYVNLTMQLGANAVITLYCVNGKWVRDPDTTQIALEPPGVTVSHDAGVKTEPVTVTVAAHHETDAAPTIYYTLDGSQPTRHSHSFTSSGQIRFDTAGTKTLKYRARDAAGNWSDTVTKVYRMDIGDTKSTISCDRPSGVYPGDVDATISASDPNTLVYYTDDGSDPSNAKNRNRKSFKGSKRFAIQGNGAHALLCYAKDSTGKEALRAFGWKIDDHDYPETRISPSAGGSFAGKVSIDLSVSEPCKWTRYTLDGSEPSETNGETYTAPIMLDRSARLSFRSRSVTGKLEPVKTANFIVTEQPDRLVFDSDDQRTGYLVEQDDKVMVGTGDILRIGAVPNGGSRAVLHFDTSTLPHNVAISGAYLEVAFQAKSGDPWSGGRRIEIDLQDGRLGSSRVLSAGAWNATVTAEAVAQIGQFSSGTQRSTDFSQTGLDAINKTGVTQIRLRMTPAPDAKSKACLMLEGGQKARLHVMLARRD